MKLLFILCLPVLILSGSIEWKKVDSLFGGIESYTMSLISVDGFIHVLSQINTKNLYREIRYTKILQDGTVTSQQTISGNYSAVIAAGELSAKISEDGKHLVVAYNAYRVNIDRECNIRSTDSCMEIFFTESLDGGESWTKPIRMNRPDMNDIVDRLQPAILLEDTGRVYLMYSLNYSFIISIRQPGAKDFENERTLIDTHDSGYKYLGQSIENSKRYIHLIWKPYTTAYTVKYMRTSDDGKTWSTPITLAETDYADLLSPVRVTKEGKIFFQYFKGIDIKIIWSKDHGNTWEDPIRIGSDDGNNNALDICGKDNKERIFSFNVKRLFGSGYLRYLTPGDKNHHDLKYPFHNFKEVESVHLSCIHNQKGQYIVFPILKEKDQEPIYFAYGIATDL